ncbi:hypothetical protein Vretimale_12043 [Volvox reticuliferus]|nr:hypothetical protein Vretifemale_11529 [Volvox reticuliferus]GIM07957.1 hypothetical protein Vretimale_12043 [Volvox reticuliferus]
MDTTPYLSYVAQKYGRVCKIWFGTRPWLVVSDPDLVRKLASQSVARPLDLTTFLDTLTGENRHIELASAFFAHGESWRRGRRAFEAAIVHPASLTAHLPAIRRCLDRFIPSLERYAVSGTPLNAQKALGDLMLAITGELAYGVDFEVDFNADYGETEQQPRQHERKSRSAKANAAAAAAAAAGPGATLAHHCRETFETFKLENASLYVGLQLMFPSLAPAIRLLATYLPDANQRRIMTARSAVNAISRRLISQWDDAVNGGDAGNVKEAVDATVTVAAAPSGGAAAAAAAAAAGAKDMAEAAEKMAKAGPVGNGWRTVTADGRHRGVGGGTTMSSSPFREVGGGVSGSSFLAAMLEGRKGAEGPLTDLEVVAQSVTFILASYETSSTTTSMALLLLATHPGAQRRLLDEVERTGDRELTVELLGELPYTEAVLKETMRLYPAVPTMFRHARNDICLEHGQVVPSGTFLVMPTFNLHHDPTLWPQHDRFIPERFLPSTSTGGGGGGSDGGGEGGGGIGVLGSSHPAAWAGFGIGARMCVGHKLAMMIGKATLVSVLRRFSLSPVPGQPLPPAMATGLTFGPREGVWLQLGSRQTPVPELAA